MSQGVPPGVVAFIALGANLGDAAHTVLAAMIAIGHMKGVVLTSQSSLWGSAPIDSGGGDYVNAVVKVETQLDAQALLEGLFSIEQEAGRERPYRNAPRTLDLDLLLYGQEHIHTPSLQVPHPRMWERAFVLQPLAEVAPECVSARQLDAVAGQGVWRIPLLISAVLPAGGSKA